MPLMICHFDVEHEEQLWNRAAAGKAHTYWLCGAVGPVEHKTQTCYRENIFFVFMLKKIFSYMGKRINLFHSSTVREKA